MTWIATSTLARSARSRAELEAASALALAKAKEALLAYVAHYAARADHQVPGRMPCPEPLSPPAGQEGVAASLACTGNTQTYVGRLPWRTLGIDPLRDGSGEPLWYVLGPGFRSAPINFDSRGGLALDGAAHAAVALIIAPGAPLDTSLETAAPPAGCARTNQSALRYPKPFVAFDPAQFLECGNAGGTYRSGDAAPWGNDRVLAITDAEVMRAIAGPLADRLQRAVAPAIAAWDASEFAATGKSWGATHGITYLPFAAPFGNPALGAYCGESGAQEGLPPIPARATTACNSAWSGAATPSAGLENLGCAALATELRCSFRSAGSVLPSGARISAQAAHVAGSFRGTLTAADVGVSHGGSATLVLSLSAASGRGSATLDVAWPGPLGAGEVVVVSVPHLPDARLLQDTRLAWFLNNQWYRHVHYAVAPAAVLGAPAACALPGDPGCIAVHGLPSSTGAAGDKRLVLTLMGQALPFQSRACAMDLNANGIADCDDAAQYLEAENAVSGDRAFRADWRVPTPAAVPPPWPPLNDRIATCPLHHTRHNGSIVQVCG